MSLEERIAQLRQQQASITPIMRLTGNVDGLAIDARFWNAHGEELEARFEKWAGPVVRPNVDEEDDMTK